jgi:hypothetical protein
LPSFHRTLGRLEDFDVAIGPKTTLNLATSGGSTTTVEPD